MEPIQSYVRQPLIKKTSDRVVQHLRKRAPGGIIGLLQGELMAIIAAHNWKGCGTVEGTRSLDVMHLARAGYLADLRSGNWLWTYRDGTNARIDFQGGRHEVILDYRVRSHGEQWQSVYQLVPVRWTPCRFGGERPWFVCDVSSNGVYCGRQVARLYGAGRLFACRHY